MANLNKVHLIGRLGKDPECRTFQGGGKVAQFSLCVNNRKKSGNEWVEDPCWIDVKAFNRQTGMQLADLIEQYLHKGNQCYIEGHLVKEEWEKEGVKNSKHVVVVDQVQFLEPKKDGESNGSSAPPRGAKSSPPRTGKPAPPRTGKPAPPANDGFNDDTEDIPF